jgi:hypothetical protein
MSQEARNALVASPNTFFQADSQRTDLESLTLTQTDLIALLTELVGKGHILEFTAIKSDHHDDSNLGEHCHFNGYCADLWPLASRQAGDYLDADDPRFQAFLRDVDASGYTYQIGLAGSAWTSANAVAAGDSVFHDDGEDHVHIGAR